MPLKNHISNCSFLTSVKKTSKQNQQITHSYNMYYAKVKPSSNKKKNKCNARVRITPRMNNSW